jgi:hypothetical protein
MSEAGSVFHDNSAEELPALRCERVVHRNRSLTKIDPQVLTITRIGCLDRPCQICTQATFGFARNRLLGDNGHVLLHFVCLELPLYFVWTGEDSLTSRRLYEHKKSPAAGALLSALVVGAGLAMPSGADAAPMARSVAQTTSTSTDVATTTSTSVSPNAWSFSGIYEITLFLCQQDGRSCVSRGDLNRNAFGK